MRIWVPVLLLGSSLVLPFAAPAAESPQTSLSGLPEGLSRYEFGQSRKPLLETADMVREAAQDPAARRDLAGRLVSLLEDDSSLECRRFVCRQLAKIGAGPEVPALESLLADPALSDMARYALERIPAAEARAALRASLSRLSGKELIGAINSAGALRDSGSIQALSAILAGGNPEAAEAAAAALGRIGGDRAYASLQSAYPDAPPGLRFLIADAYLGCAEHMLARGDIRGLELYRDIHSSDAPASVRAGALYGLARAEGSSALQLVLAALGSEEGPLRSAALTALREMDLEGKSAELAAHMVRLEPDRQVLFLGSLSVRKDAAGRPAAAAGAAGEHENVRLAAYRALSLIGDSSALDILLPVAVDGQDEERKAAREAIERIPDEEADRALAEKMKSASAGFAPEIVRGLAARNSPLVIPIALDAVKTGSGSLAIESAKALGKLGDRRAFAPLLGLLGRTGEEDIREASGEALGAICRGDEEPAELAVMLAEELSGFPEPGRPALLGLFPILGGDELLEALRREIAHSSGVGREAAIRALGEWPDFSPAGDLIQIARTGDSDKDRLLALRGYIRLAGLPGDRPASETARIYEEGFSVAVRPEERKMVLGALQKIGEPFALELASSCLSDPELAAEAAAAVRGASRRLRFTDPALCLAALKRARKAAGEGEIRAKIDGDISAIRAHERYLTAWRICGPYGEEGATFAELLDRPFSPEKPGDTEAKWRSIRPDAEDERPWRIDLAGPLGEEEEDCVGYLRTWVYSPRSRRVRAEVGSDDGVKVWLNGKVVHRNSVVRSLTDRQDRFKVTLREGWNEILLKVSQDTGEWKASMRLGRSLGRRVPGLKFSESAPAS